MAKYIMALDQGTTSSRCILFDKAGNICSMAQREFEQIYPKPGWVEHNPMEIWSTQYAVMSEAMALVGATPKDILEQPTSVKLQLCGIKKQVSLYIMLLYGSADVQPRILICL